jgi:hypothetical protein
MPPYWRVPLLHPDAGLGERCGLAVVQREAQNAGGRQILRHSHQQASQDIMEKLATLQQATKRALYEAILYPGVENFTRYFRLQNYWTQQAGLFSMSAKKAMLENPELDYNLQHSHYNGTVKQPAGGGLCRPAPRH